MVESRSCRHGNACAAAVLALCGLIIAACSGAPAPVSIAPVYKITGAPAANTSGPVVAEIRPGAAHGELRFVVVPPEQAHRRRRDLAEDALCGIVTATGSPGRS